MASLRATVAVVLACFLLSATEARAQIDGIHVAVTPSAGWTGWDQNVRFDNVLVVGGDVALMFNRRIGLEAGFSRLVADTERATPPDLVHTRGRDVEVRSWSAGVIVNLRHSATVSPYLRGGWHQARFHSQANRFRRAVQNGPELGAGVRVRLTGRGSVRGEIRNLLWSFDSKSQTPPFEPTLHHSRMYKIGVQFEIGGFNLRADTDGDGVLDRFDRCPSTPRGAFVDAAGCTFDSDGDGVLDGIDRCPGTPPGAIIDAFGCPTDSDGDGVPDGLDRCPDTPRGVIVDASGCPLDSDGDGVFDGLDQCPHTPPGAVVDRFGCPRDSDGDGVFDGIDRCLDTPPGTRVDRYGCPF